LEKLLLVARHRLPYSAQTGAWPRDRKLSGFLDSILKIHSQSMLQIEHSGSAKPLKVSLVVLYFVS
jgi:hypothetical protein